MSNWWSYIETQYAGMPAVVIGEFRYKRVLVAQDMEPHEPDWDGLPYTVWLNSRWDSVKLVALNKQTDELPYGTLTQIERALSKGDGGALADRYLRFVHGAKVVAQIRSFVYQGGDDLLIFDTHAWRKKWSIDPDYARSEEYAKDMVATWQAWLDGDVYGVIEQQRVTWTPDHADMEPRVEWETTDSVWGYYGFTDAESQARSWIDD